MGTRLTKLTLTSRLELMELDRNRFELTRFAPLSPYIAGIEATQAIQYYKSKRHLTDPADQLMDNCLGMAAYKAAWVRVYVRSGFFQPPVTMTGKIVLERQRVAHEIPLLNAWDFVGEFAPQGAAVAQQSWDYAAERGSTGATLDFIIPADSVHGRLRITAVIWPTGGSEASPSDTDETYADATLLQTLRVRGILISYNGPNATGTVPNMNLPAPPLANLQATCATTHTVYPVESTGVFSNGGTIAWNTPLTGMATSPGGCSQQWYDLNALVAEAKANDGNRTDVLYVGLLPMGVPIANVGGCNSSGVSAVPDGQQWTMAHELGHAAGLGHGPCGTPGDANYPAYEPYDPPNTPTATLGEYGLDINNGVIHPPAEKDFMSYCNPVWISVYHYKRLYDNPALDPRWIDVPRQESLPELYDPWLWPWEYIPDPPPWELPSHFVKTTVQPVISLIGIVNLAGEVSVTSVMRVNAVPKLPEAAPTTMVAELLGAGGSVVARAPVMQTPAHGSGCDCWGAGHGHGGHGLPPNGYAFQALLSDVEPGSELRIVRVHSCKEHENETVWSRKAASAPPRVTRVTVRIEKTEAILRWQASGRSGSDLQFSIQFSKDKGVSWNGLVAGLRNQDYRFSLAEMPSGMTRFRVLAHDGFFTAHAESRPVRLPPRPPVVSILHPHDGRRYAAGGPLRLYAAVNTHVGARNPKLKLQWQVDGRRTGEGSEVWISSPKPGRHKCRVIARDDGGQSEATVAFITEE